MAPFENPTQPAEKQAAERRQVARRPRLRCCLLKGCERRFHPRQARQRYCSQRCREEARKWSRWKARQRYRETAAGQQKRNGQSRRVVRFASLPGDLLDSLRGDFITENPGQVLASVRGGDLAGISPSVWQAHRRNRCPPKARPARAAPSCKIEAGSGVDTGPFGAPTGPLNSMLYGGSSLAFRSVT